MPAVTFSEEFLATQAFTSNVNAAGDVGNAGGSDQGSRFNISNAFVNVARNTGFFRYGASVGLYSIPVVGLSGNNTLGANVNTNVYGPVPSLYVSLNPNNHTSIMVGKLATLIGQEYTYTYLNSNIQRGLVWNMETAVSRGVRLTATEGKYTGALELNDGFYSGHFLGVEGSLALAADANTSYQFVFVVPNSDAPSNPTSTIANKRLYNFMYTASRGRWSLAPYILLVQSPQSSALGYSTSESAYGLVFASTYSFNPTWSLTGRIEDIANRSTTSDQSPNADLVGYGPGSGAWSFTLTPTYHYEHFLLRSDLSEVTVRSAAPGSAFGATGSQRNQFRIVVESGLEF
ncbi:MAG: outer membrane beta-barrel protein [Vulcanimicrobiaceae bacterium]